MKRLCALALSMAVVGSAQPTLAQEPPRVELRERLNRGDAIGVELNDGRRITGTVGDTQWDGFWVGRPPAEATFVRFRATRALLDPDTGIVIGITAHDRDGLPRWVLPTLTVVGIVALAAWATGGRFPFGFFLPTG